MKKLLGISFVSCLLMFGAVSSIAQELSYGLKFNSFEVVQEKRTGLNLSPSKKFSFPNGFSLAFDVFFYSDPQYHFGNIFRINGENNQHIDFFATPDPEKLTVLNSEDKVLAESVISESSNNFSDFFPFQFNLDIKNNALKITIGEKVFSLKVDSLKSFREVSITFGKCNNPLFPISDVPRMIIKNIRINNIDGDALYYWKLSKHASDGVYDELENRFAKVENPQWLLDDHAFWKKRTSFQTLKNPQIAYNSDEKTIAIADSKSFFTYNTSTNKLIQNKNSSGFVYSSYVNQMIYNPSDSAYYSYCFSQTDGSRVAAYNFASKSWNNDDISESNSEYWHHNRYVSPKEDCFYLFGGYGQHKYKNTINKYSFKTQKWEKMQYKNESIPPRYLSGLGVIDENKLLLFGGYGNSSGLQFLSPRNYYDLYEIDLPGLTVKKVWEMETPKNQFVVANSLIVDTLNKCFYALCFPQNQYETSLFFAKFSLQKPGYEIVSDNIPFYFNDILSYADLFQNKDTKELYAVTFSSLTTDSLATVSIYSLSYPPLEPESSVYQPVKIKNNSNFLLVGLFILLLIFIVAGYELFRRKKKTKPEIKTAENETNAETVIKSEYFDEFTDEELRIMKPVNERNKKQSIFLFGGFQVKDINENDVTGEFSPMLKQLFLIILLHSFTEDGKGISTTKLNEIFWSDKTRDSARNNRSVMTSKIRQLFENVGDLNVEGFNSYWTIKLGSDIYLDYREALYLIRNMKNKNSRTKENVLKLLNIVSFGELLPNVQVEWVDPFKAGFANELIDLLINVSKHNELALSPFEMVYLADTVLIFDVLNDDALKLKCSALIKMGKNGLAKAAYNSFTKQYSILFGTNYNYSFTQVIS